MRTVLTLPRQAVLRQADQLRVGAAGIEAPRRLARIAQRGLAQDRAGAPAGEGWDARQHLAEDRAQREHFGPLVDLVNLPARLLGRHVRRRAQDRSGARELGIRVRAGLGARRGDDRLVADLAGGGVVDHPATRQHLGQAPVHHLDFAETPHHHVRRLQVAVDHAAGMRVGRRLADGLEDREMTRKLGGRVGPLGEKLGEGVSLDQLHREEGPAIGECAEFIDRHDPRVLELSADPGLLDEPADHGGVVAEVFAEDLQGHIAAEVGVAALEHRAHAAARDLAVDAVADRAAGGEGDGSDDRPRLFAGSRVTQEHPGYGPDRLGEGRQHTLPRRFGHPGCAAPPDAVPDSAAPIRNCGQSRRGESEAIRICILMLTRELHHI